MSNETLLKNTIKKAIAESNKPLEFHQQKRTHTNMALSTTVPNAGTLWLNPRESGCFNVTLSGIKLIEKIQPEFIKKFGDIYRRDMKSPVWKLSDITKVKQAIDIYIDSIEV